MSHIVHLWTARPTPGEPTIDALKQAQIPGCASLFHLFSRPWGQTSSLAPHLWLVTRGAAAAGSRPSPLQVAQAPLWGLGKVVALEYPGIWGGMVDLAREESENDAETLLGEIWNPEAEDHVAFRNEGRYVLRLVPTSSPDPRPTVLQADATYMITGGLGSLGLRVAGWMVQAALPSPVLTGRREASSQSQESLDRLRHAGAEVTVVRADVSDEAAMNLAFAEIHAAGPPLRGIVHAAGVLG